MWKPIQNASKLMVIVAIVIEPLSEVPHVE